MSYRMAVDIGATRTHFAIVERDMPRIVTRDRPMSSVIFTGERPGGAALASATRRFLDDKHIPLADICGIGVGVPGVVDVERRNVIVCPNLSVLDGASIVDDLQNDLSIPAFLDNNTNLIALGEHTAGVGRKVDDMAAVFVGSGVGSGLILNGQVYHSSNGMAGEFGHTKVVPGGRLCTCGGHGCVEMYCSAKALERTAQTLFDPRELFQLGTRYAGAALVIDQANSGHQGARAAMIEAFEYMGVALANLVNLLSPQLLVLGGGVVKAWPESINVVSNIIQRESSIEMPREIEVVESVLENDAGVLGGAALVSQSLN